MRKTWLWSLIGMIGLAVISYVLFLWLSPPALPEGFFIGWRANPHFGPFHILSLAFIGGGFWLLAAAWKVLYAAQHARATAGPYAHIRNTSRSYSSCSAFCYSG